MIKVISIKRFQDFHGTTDEEWSNGYHFNGPQPAGPSEWEAIFSFVWNVEKNMITAKSRLVHMYGYNDPAGNASYGHDYRTEAARPGERTSGTTDNFAPPEMCSLVKFRAGQTSQGKPKYLFKWYHSALQSDDGDGKGEFVQGQVDLLDTFRDGTGYNGYTLCTPGGTPAGEPDINPYLFSRDVKRRGRRPTAG